MLKTMLPKIKKRRCNEIKAETQKKRPFFISRSFTILYYAGRIVAFVRKINVKLYAHEDDRYVELYKVIKGDTEVKYFARHTSTDGDDGEWYFVSDPDGYCELDYSCPGDYIFVVCDSKGKELFRDSNGEIRNPFPTLERKAEMSWLEVMERYPIRKEGLKDWLLSFLTKEVSDTILKDLPCHEGNWPQWYDEVKREIIHRYDHLGEKYCIYKTARKHKYCDCEWAVYISGFEEDGEDNGFIKWHGVWFDDSVTGANYSPNEANEVVRKALESLYTEKYVSYLNRTIQGDYEQKMNYRKAADFLLGRNYDRKFVHEVIAKEKENKSFYDNFEAIRKDFPDAKIDYSFNY